MSGLMEEEDSMKRKKIYGIFMLVAIAVFLFAGGRILQIYLNYQETAIGKIQDMLCSVHSSSMIR